MEITVGEHKKRSQVSFIMQKSINFIVVMQSIQHSLSFALIIFFLYRKEIFQHIVMI